MKRPAVPGSASTPTWPPVHTVGTITWPDGKKVTASMESHWQSEERTVTWEGETSRIKDPPATSSACYLLVYLQCTAADAGGKFTSETTGHWPLKDEVTK